MKQLLFILLTFISTLNTLLAQEAHPYEKTSWNVIRERLFNGENSNAYRFEDDIRFQFIGAKSHQDSAIIINMIGELNGLIETVQIKIVDTEPNYKLIMEEEAGGQSSNYRTQTSGSKIVSVNLDLGFLGTIADKESVNQLYYDIIRQLTKLYIPQQGSTGYGGVFDSNKASDAEFKEIDKYILTQLYSHDFYKNLKHHTVRHRDYQYYLDLRYHSLILNFSYSLKAILILFGFLYFLSKESKRKQNPGLLLYIKQRAVILLILPFLFSFVETSGSFSVLLLRSPGIFISNVLGTVIYGLLVLVFIYYTEPFFLKRINNFIGRQVFIFLSINFAAFIVPAILVFLFLLFSNPSLLSDYNWATIGIQNSSHLFLIIFIAALRVFYNFVIYRIKSMVNQKDVEIAKMKELKNQAELNALHSRINPHFLYNSLNSIASLAHIDADKTENMATGLSELFRYSINKENKTFVTVAEELGIVRKYLEIEKIRFGNKLVYEINVDESTREKQIPKFLIQPLVENAIKHGLSKIKGIGNVLVEVKQIKEDMVIIIFDNGPDFSVELVSGYGLQNLHDKLDIIYGDDAIINWENGVNKHFKVILKNQFKS